MKIYLAGPMSNIPQQNFPAFDAAAAELRSRGFTVISPAELDDPADRALALADAPATKTWGDFLARDVKLIADSGIEGIFFLPGWIESRGARLEAFVGALSGLCFCLYQPGGFSRPVSRTWIINRLQESFDATSRRKTA